MRTATLQIPKVSIQGNRLILRCPYEDRELAKHIPGYKWDSTEKAWTYPVRPEVIADIRRLFPTVSIDAEAVWAVQRIEDREKAAWEVKRTEDIPVIPDYHFKTQPFDHQKKAMTFVLRLWGLI